MFAKVMFVQQELVNGSHIRTQRQRCGRHFRDRLKDASVDDSLHSIGAPGERCVARNQHPGKLSGFQAVQFEMLFNHLAGVEFVCLFNLDRKSVV